MKSLLLGSACALALMAGAAKADAAPLVADGLTYTLTYSTVNASTEAFTLTITGINGASDTEGGRYGVNAISFNDPIANTQPSSVTAPAGFTYVAGGLNSSGCNGNGNFFCFSANTTPTGPALAANSSLSFNFTLSTAPTAFPSVYSPDLKIDWVGTKRNYDLVSQTITAMPSTPTNTPEPASLALLGAAVAGLGLVRRRR